MVDALRLCAPRMEEWEGGCRQTQSSPGGAHGDIEAESRAGQSGSRRKDLEGPTVRSPHHHLPHTALPETK